MMRHLTRLAKQVQYHFRDKKAQKYTDLLLAAKIQLIDVPLSLLRDPQFCSVLYLTAFRIDRSVSREQYEFDLTLLCVEATAAQMAGNLALQSRLERILKSKKSDLDHNPEIMSWN